MPTCLTSEVLGAVEINLFMQTIAKISIQLLMLITNYKLQELTQTFTDFQKTAHVGKHDATSRWRQTSTRPFDSITFL